MRFSALILAVTLIPSSVFAAGASFIEYQTADAPLTTNFSVDTKTSIPGASISPGQYSISVVEHLTDRVILRVSDKDGKVKSMFLGLTTTSLPASGSIGPILWTGKGENVLRGFSFAGAPPVEFVYPKAQAVTIAKNNSDKVLAIDPASDNLSVTHDNLSKEDMQIVTLWTLKSTRVGPNAQPGIEAARYHVPVAPTPVEAAPVEVASVNPPAPPRVTSAPKPVVAAAAKDQAAPPQRKHVIAVLPHTASNLPSFLLAAVLSLLGAVMLNLRRKYAGNA